MISEAELTSEVATFPEMEEIHLAALVLAAAGIPHLIEVGGEGWLLLVAGRDEAQARAELGLFAAENRDWPPLRAFGPAEEAVVEKRPPVLPVLGSLIAFHLVTGGSSDHNWWFAAGALAREEVLGNGQWWRLLTALTLHADSVHLLGNVFFGGVLAHALCRHLGSGLAWSAVLGSGLVANLVNMLLHDGSYRSVGFSTAVFAMVGLLSGMRLRRVGGRQELLLALGSAAALLALLGSSGERTDLGAHFWGIGVGFAAGLLLAAAGLARGHGLGAGWQWLLSGLSLLTLLAAWFCAFSV